MQREWIKQHSQISDDVYLCKDLKKFRRFIIFL